MPGGSNPGSAWAQLDATTTSMRSLMVAHHGDGAKLVWGTEFGAHTDPAGQGFVDETEQAAVPPRGYELWSSFSWAGPLTWFSSQDTGADPSLRDDFFGLTRTGGAPKPAYFAFKALARSRTELAQAAHLCHPVTAARAARTLERTSLRTSSTSRLASARPRRYMAMKP